MDVGVPGTRSRRANQVASQQLMVAFLMILGADFANQVPEMSATEDEEFSEALIPDCANGGE